MKISASIAVIAVLAAAPAGAAVVEETFDLEVTAANSYGRTFTQPIKVTVFRDDARARSPYLVLSHGRPANAADFAKMGRQRYSENSEYFVSKGFAVFVPTRMGYGVSGGEDMEYNGGCSLGAFEPAFEAAARQVVKVVEHARGLPYVEPDRGLLVGQSVGGATTLAVAAKNVAGIVAAVNFAGGSGGDPVNRPNTPCRSDRIEDLYGTYGAATRIPTLWLYSENDRFWGPDKPKAWFEAYRKKGAPAEFVALPPSGTDGHGSFTRNPGGWRPAFEAFLRRNGF